MTEADSSGSDSTGIGPTGDDPVQDAQVEYQRIAGRLIEELDGAIIDWIIRVVNERIPSEWSDERRQAVQPAIRAVADQTHADVQPRLSKLLSADVEAQSAGPLGVLRASVGPANRFLAGAAVPPPRRDPVTESMFPDDPYDLGPANFADVSPELHEPGLIWGAAKAHVVLVRHRH